MCLLRQVDVIGLDQIIFVEKIQAGHLSYTTICVLGWEGPSVHLATALTFWHLICIECACYDQFL